MAERKFYCDRCEKDTPHKYTTSEQGDRIIYDTVCTICRNRGFASEANAKYKPPG